MHTRLFAVDSKVIRPALAKLNILSCQRIVSQTGIAGIRGITHQGLTEGSLPDVGTEAATAQDIRVSMKALRVGTPFTLAVVARGWIGHKGWVTDTGLNRGNSRLVALGQPSRIYASVDPTLFSRGTVCQVGMGFSKGDSAFTCL